MSFKNIGNVYLQANSFKEIRWKQRFQNFQKAFVIFNNRCNDLSENPEGSKYYETCQMALVQAFEILIELSWKTLKDYLENEGFSELYTGKKVFRQAFQVDVIENPEIWLKSLELRNLTGHTYDLTVVYELCKFIIDNFSIEAKKLEKKLKSKL
ncbi:MAG: nucleotidyltransferase [Treponema sp.]|nr:MAG: nucleotidyltransferase [Treponema sp.]